MRIRGILSEVLLSAVSLIGLLALLSPFLASSRTLAPALRNGPWLTVAVILLCMAAVSSRLRLGKMSPDTAILLGMMILANAALRAATGRIGLGLALVLPIISGYVFGPTFGFLLGAGSVLVSAFFGPEVGPELPLQMLGIAWAGLVAGWLPEMRTRDKLESVTLAAWGLLSSFLLGILKTLWAWPFPTDAMAPGIAWRAALNLEQAWAAFLGFYRLASLKGDLGREVGVFLLVLLGSLALLRPMRHLHRATCFTGASQLHSTGSDQSGAG